VETVEKTEYHPPPRDPDDALADDRLQDKHTAFDPRLVDRRPLRDWLVNASAAVIRLDTSLIRPDVEPNLEVLYPSFAAAVGTRADILPSVNLLDGKAKQFDDGLYAALDLAYYRGLKDRLHSHVELVRRIYERAGKHSASAPFLAAGLELAGVHVEAEDVLEKDRLLRQFQRDEVASKPIGFYTWNTDLAASFRFLRFFQREFGERELAVPAALAQALAGDESVLADYRKALGFYAKLINPSICLSVADVLGTSALDAGQMERLCQARKVTHRSVALFPPSASREAVLFEKLFPTGLPEQADLMRELIRRIRSAEVDLRPKADSGWYAYQAYALETLLLPGKGPEKDKLLLTTAYKKRMLEAFKALITKRRETHVRQLAVAEALSAAPPLENVQPRLRVEPCPTYLLRTARAYAFLDTFLEAAVGQYALQSLHGLTDGGERKPDLRRELHAMRDLFYGLYLISTEDIGMHPTFVAGEPVEQERCYRLAADWLAKAFQDDDLKVDTRVMVPVFIDRGREVVRLWATLGVRLVKLEASYVRPPSVKPVKGPGDWQPVGFHKLRASDYLIPVDEFAEIEVPGLRVLSREQWRAVCDRGNTREGILQLMHR
jgi:hypothetical protein